MSTRPSLKPTALNPSKEPLRDPERTRIALFQNPYRILKIAVGGSGVVISRVISPVIWVISIVTLRITLLITSHEPPSMQPGPDLLT